MSGINAYKVWCEGEYYLLIGAESSGAAKAYYAGWGGSPADAFEKDARLHCHLIERDIEFPGGDLSGTWGKSRHYDLIFAGIIHPDWAELKMTYGWWWHEKGEEHDW